MDAIEIALKIMIFSGLLTPVWVLVAFLVGLVFDAKSRSTSFYWCERHSKEVKQRIEKSLRN